MAMMTNVQAYHLKNMQAAAIHPPWTRDEGLITPHTTDAHETVIAGINTYFSDGVASTDYMDNYKHIQRVRYQNPYVVQNTYDDIQHSMNGVHAGKNVHRDKEDARYNSTKATTSHDSPNAVGEDNSHRTDNVDEVGEVLIPKVADDKKVKFPP